MRFGSVFMNICIHNLYISYGLKSIVYFKMYNNRTGIQIKYIKARNRKTKNRNSAVTAPTVTAPTVTAPTVTAPTVTYNCDQWHSN